MEPTATDRMEIDRWLAGLFLRQLDRTAIDLYRSPEGAALLHQLSAVPALASLVDTLRTTVTGPVDPERLRLDLAASYGRLFLTGGPRSVPLFASAYLSDTGLLMQGPARETQSILARLDMSAPPGFREPADHIGVQLNILAGLAGGAGAGWLTEAEYLRAHLLPWVPTLAAMCARLSPEPLYRALGTATLAWLRAVEARLAAETADA